MQGSIDTSFHTIQRDLFNSGVAAEIGMNAFGVWSAVKTHADFETGAAWPSMRRLMEITGLSSATVQKAINILVDHHMLRIEKGGKGKKNVYVARERLDVRFGNRVVCTVVVDYIPSQLRSKLTKLKTMLETGEKDDDALVNVDIIPGPGFLWSQKDGILRTTAKASEVVSPEPTLPAPDLTNPLVLQALEIKARGER